MKPHRLLTPPPPITRTHNRGLLIEWRRTMVMAPLLWTTESKALRESLYGTSLMLFRGAWFNVSIRSKRDILNF